MKVLEISLVKFPVQSLEIFSNQLGSEVLEVLLEVFLKEFPEESLGKLWRTLE